VSERAGSARLPFEVAVVTLFPEQIRAYLGAGVVGRAVERGIVHVATTDPRAFASDVHRTVDDRPFGGGPGMLLKVEPLFAAVTAAAGNLPAGCPRIHLTAQGRPFDAQAAQRLAELPGILLLAGRYEGVDERLLEECIDEELSIGDYVLSGGELPALVVIDAIARLLPGVLNDPCSAFEESFTAGLLEGPQYTRPEEWRGRKVPGVLRGGDHAAIRRWRRKQALGRTAERRPDLLAEERLDANDRALLREYRDERVADQTGAAPETGLPVTRVEE
jgi:tRNA (guanine37-N1)-methyltransferase